MAEELVELARARLQGAELARVESATIGIRALPVDRMPVDGPALEGRYGDPEELGSFAAWVLSEAPAHLTGAVLNVDGGMTAPYLRSPRT